MRLLLLKNIPGSPSTSFNEISNTSSIAKSNGNTSPSASISNSTSVKDVADNAVVIYKDEIVETNMDDIEIQIVLDYYNKNKEFMEKADAEVL